MSERKIIYFDTGPEPDIQAFNEQPNSTPQEIPELKREKEPGLHERLGTLIRSISGKPSLKVTTKMDQSALAEMKARGMDPRKSWYRQIKKHPRTKKVIEELVRIPDEIFESTENIAKGKAAHEAGHVAITRFGEFIPDEVMQELGFHSVIASVEERPTDQVVRARYEGAGKWIDEAREEEANKGSESATTKGKERIGYQPKISQLGDLIVYGPHFKDIPDFYEEDVLEVYKRIEPELQELENTLPQEGAPEAEVYDKAVERYKRLYNKIWPEAKKLVAEDQKREELRQMIREQLKKDRGQSEENSELEQGGGESIFDQLPDELKQELLQAIIEAASESLDDSLGKGEGENQEGGEDKTFQKSSEETEGEENKKEAEDTGGPEDKIPMDKLSEELIKELQKIFDKLPSADHEQLKNAAKQKLEDLEDEIVKERTGQMLDNNPETHAEYKERKEQEAKEDGERKEEKAKEKERKEREAEERENIKREMDEIEKRLADATKQSVYEKTFQEIRLVGEELYRELERIFNPNLKSSVRLKSTGSRINLPAVFRWEAEKGAGKKEINSKIFETLHIPEKKDYAVTLMVDLSGSMQGKKIEETFKAVVLIAEMLNRLGIRNQIFGFQDELIEFKKPDEDLTDKIRAKIAGMIDEVWNYNPGGHNRASFNDDGPCLMEASAMLAKEFAKEKIIIVLSDGLPMGRRSDQDDLHKAVSHIIKNSDQKLVAAGLGPGTGHVKTFYPASLPNLELKDLPTSLGGLLREVLTSPEKFKARNS